MSGITRPRFHWEDRFTLVPNEWARDGRISRRARGLLLELMSHEPGWVTSVQQLIDGGQEGKDAIRADLNALVDAGYLRRLPAERQQGRYAGVSWEVSDPFERIDRGGSAATVNPPPKKNTPEEETQSPTEMTPSAAKPKAKPRKAPSTPLPEGWKPSDTSRAFALQEQLDVEDEAARFRARALAKDERYVRWDQAFALWLRNSAKWRKERAATAAPKSDEPRPDPNAWMEALKPPVEERVSTTKPEGWTGGFH